MTIIRVKRRDKEARQKSRESVYKRVQEHLSVEADRKPEPIFKIDRLTGKRHHYPQVL